MVYDIGGGTLDVSLLNLNNGIFEVMAATGDNRLGGQDFNLALLEHLVTTISGRLAEVEAGAAGGEKAKAKAAAAGRAALRLETSDEMRALREESERIKVGSRRAGVQSTEPCDATAASPARGRWSSTTRPTALAGSTHWLAARPRSICRLPSRPPPHFASRARSSRG